MEEWQRENERYQELSAELLRAYDRELMYLQRAQAANRRAAKQDFISFYSEIFQAIFFGGKWPGAEMRMWDKHAKQARHYIRSVQKELTALGFPPDLDDPKSLAACYGPLVEDQNPPGSEFTLTADDGQIKKVIIRWVFKDTNGERFYLIEHLPVEES